MKEKYISLIIPVYNEEKYIDSCVDSLLKQDYPQDCMEWIFVDGMSVDKTIDILNSYYDKYPELINILKNPRKTVPYAMNIGIENSKGEYIIRLDAHAEYKNDYISKCVYYLETTDAENVGGITITRGKGFKGNSIAKMLSCKFGVGNSDFRTNGTSGYVDTVPFGAFRRDVFKKLGGYDERLTRNQDNEMNYRIRNNGGKIYLASDIVSYYYCRDSIKGIVKMAMTNGKWNIITMNICPGSMSIRHFIPLAFLLSLVILPLLGLFNKVFTHLFLIEIILYFILDFLFSYKQSDNFKDFLFLVILFPIFHITYGFGSLKGLYSIAKNEIS